jgi:hypothetical protein
MENLNPQIFAQYIQEQIMPLFTNVKQSMKEEEVYALFTDIDASGVNMKEIAPITKEMRNYLEVVLHSAKNNELVNTLLIFNNTKKTQKAEFCVQAKLGQGKGFALMQVKNAMQMNMNTSGELLVSVNQNINIKENFQLVLHPNDFIFVAISSLGKNIEDENSSVSLIFKCDEWNNKIIYGVIGLIVLLVLLYILYVVCTNDDVKKIKPNQPLNVLPQQPLGSNGNSGNAFYFF